MQTLLEPLIATTAASPPPSAPREAGPGEHPFRDLLAEPSRAQGDSPTCEMEADTPSECPPPAAPLAKKSKEDHQEEMNDAEATEKMVAADVATAAEIAPVVAPSEPPVASVDGEENTTLAIDDARALLAPMDQPAEATTQSPLVNADVRPVLQVDGDAQAHITPASGPSPNDKPPGPSGIHEAATPTATDQSLAQIGTSLPDSKTSPPIVAQSIIDELAESSSPEFVDSEPPRADKAMHVVPPDVEPPRLPTAQVDGAIAVASFAPTPASEKSVEGTKPKPREAAKRDAATVQPAQRDIAAGDSAVVTTAAPNEPVMTSPSAIAAAALVDPGPWPAGDASAPRGENNSASVNEAFNTVTDRFGAMLGPRRVKIAHGTHGQPLSESQQARLVQRVARAIDTARLRGDAEIKLRLSPPELGSLKIEMRLESGALTARLEVETAAAQQALADNLGSLRQRLAEQNIRVEQFDIDLLDRNAGNPSDGGPGQPAERERHAPPHGFARAGQRRHEANTTSESPAPRVTAAMGSTSLDVLI